jgi:lipopolysaccharide/colanic/teichoic acid biosynthesis glycosyltransferase
MIAYVRGEYKNKGSRIIKSVFDKVVAAIVLLVFSPLILIVAIAVYFQMGGSVIFSQPRPGKDEKIFDFYKFRTMTNERDALGNLLPDEQRIIPFGLFLRKTSLDELPQLWNILKGDMSFIGPRPLLVDYLKSYSPEQARRHEVKPGITGLAQVKGRNSISWEEKFQLDVWYIDNWSLLLDLKIIFLTVFKVVTQEGINQEGYTTSEYFTGKLQKN